MSKWKYKTAAEEAIEEGVSEDPLQIESQNVRMQIQQYISQTLIKNPEAASLGITESVFNNCLDFNSFQEGKNCVDMTLKNKKSKNKGKTGFIDTVNKVLTPKDYSNFKNLD